jgi:hypothetical protein
MLNKLILHQTAGVALVLWTNRFLEHLWFEWIHNLFCAFCEVITKHLYIIQISCTLQVPPELSYKHGSGSYLLALMWRPSFDPRSVHMRFEVDKVPLGQVFLWALQFSVSFHQCIRFILHLSVVLQLSEEWLGEAKEPSNKTVLLWMSGGFG